jgi:hypothetical protein
MSDDVDIPSIGTSREGAVLVCMGDDQPDQWAGWLEELVDEFNCLRDSATAHGLSLRVRSQGQDFGDWSDFCDAVGVNLKRQFWEGSLVSGQFVMGWVKETRVSSAKKRGESVVQKLRANLVADLKARRIEELKGIEDLDELISKVQNDRDALLEEVNNLKGSLASTEAQVAHLQAALKVAKEDAYRVARLGQFVLGVIRGGKGVLVDGPLLRWSDGTILALTKRGKVSLPDDSPHWLALQELRELGHPVVEVCEVTILGGWLSGPVYLHGSEGLSGWDDAWKDNRQLKRKFAVSASDHSKAQMLDTVVEYLGAGSRFCGL